ncbi:MAG: hypothetical protein IKM07_07085 [Clostridia bacterium]|nr:hypothetical protein [Clostridia bacterium]
MDKKYLFTGFDDDRFYHLINQAGVHAAEPPEEGNETFNTCWDGALSPDGVFYYTLSSEAGKCDHAKLVRYNFEKNCVEDCLYMGDLAMASVRVLPHSKFHTSINFRPADNKCGYHVIAVTHNTDRAPQHPEWMPFALATDIWEGFPGSQIVEFDPDTGHAEVWGTPVPRETIYGAKYDPAHDRLYMIGFQRGHVYSMNCTDRRVRDLGKAAEVFNYRLALAPDGNIYSCTKSGAYYRINTEKDCLEDLNFQTPSVSDHYRYLCCARPTPARDALFCINSTQRTMLRYDLKTGEFSIIGSIVPEDGYFDVDYAKLSYSCGNFCIDKYGVLWYELRVYMNNHKEGCRTRLNPYHSRLYRWDVLNGREPEYLGIMGTPERLHGITVEMEYDEKTDRIYCVDHGQGFGHKGPCAICIELDKFREHMYEPGPFSEDKSLRPYEISEEAYEREQARRKVGAGEQVTETNPFLAFPNRDAFPVRLWNNALRPEDTMVIGMCWDEEGMLHVVTGESKVAGEPCPIDEAKYVFRIHGRELRGRMHYDCLKDSYKDWLKANIYPQPVKFDPASLAAGERLPEVTGRRYRAVVTAEAQWHDGRTFIGTRDAQCALISPDGKVFGLGNCSSNGPVRCLCTNAAKDKLWGVSGDPEELGYVFTFDDEHGLRQLGILNYDSKGFYLPSASNILSSICLSPDEKTLAVGGADRLGTVHVIDL